MKYLIAILLPPLAVLTYGGLFQVIINCFLCLFFWIPGILHALMVVNGHENRKQTDRLVKAIETNGVVSGGTTNGGRAFSQKIVPVVGFTEKQRADELERRKVQYQKLGWEVVNYQDGGALGSKLMLRRPFGSLTWKDMDGGERFKAYASLAVLVVLGFIVINGIFSGKTKTSSTATAPDQATPQNDARRSEKSVVGRQTASSTKSTKKTQDFEAAGADEPDATIATDAFNTAMPYGLDLGLLPEEADKKIASTDLKLLSTVDVSEHSIYLTKTYSGHFAGMPAKIVVNYSSGQLYLIDIFILPKASASAAINAKLPRYIESKFGPASDTSPPLYPGAGYGYTWMNINSGRAGLMFHGSSTSKGADKKIMMEYMAFHH